MMAMAIAAMIMDNSAEMEKTAKAIRSAKIVYKGKGSLGALIASNVETFEIWIIKLLHSIILPLMFK